MASSSTMSVPTAFGRSLGTAARAFLISLSVLLISPDWAAAQSGDDASAKMKDLNRQALSDLKGGDAESARLGLLEALGLAGKSSMTDSPLAARTYVHLGAVYVNGLKDKTKGKKALLSALKIRPDINLTAETVTPELEEVFGQAKKEAGIAAASPVAAVAAKPAVPPTPVPPPPAPPVIEVKKPAPAPEAPLLETKKAPEADKPEAAEPVRKKPPAEPEELDLPANIPVPLHCPNPNEAPPREAMALHCVAQPGVRVARVMLYYRVGGGEKFGHVRTVRSPKGWYNGVIPAEAAVGKILHYYFEARDPSDQVVASNGRGESPNIMLITPGAQPVGATTMAMVRFQRKEGGMAGTAEDPLAGVAAEQAKAAREANDHRRGPRTIFVGFGAGLGQGYQPQNDRPLEFHGTAYTDPKTKKVEAAKAVGASSLPAGAFHLLPEVGYQWDESWAFSVQVRIQQIPSSGSGNLRPGGPATGALAFLARAQYALTDGDFQFVASGVLGGGDGFRLTIAPNADAGIKVNDTVRGGPIVLGPGGGILWHLNPHVAFGLDLRVLAGLPDLAVVAEANAGLQVGF